jgi:hypothetical protein
VRVDRFESLMAKAQAVAHSDRVRSTRTFAEVGYEGRSFGFVIEFDTGAQVYLQLVRSAPPSGDNHNAPENIVTGEPLAPVEVPDLVGEKIRIHDVERYLTAAIINSGSSEIRRVNGFSEREKPTHQRYGVQVDFYSGASIYVLFLHTLAPGSTARLQTEFEVLEAV